MPPAARNIVQAGSRGGNPQKDLSTDEGQNRTCTKYDSSCREIENVQHYDNL